MYYYNDYGWLTSQPNPTRSTNDVPPIETATHKANWTGLVWVLVEYTEPPAPTPPPTPIDPAEWLIDVGPFFDRFGSNKMAVLTSPDAGVKAILADLQVRHWVDLKRPDVTQALAYVGSVVAAVTPAVQSAVMTTPVSAAENVVLRKLYF